MLKFQGTWGSGPPMTTTHCSWSQLHHITCDNVEWYLLHSAAVKRTHLTGGSSDTAARMRALCNGLWNGITRCWVYTPSKKLDGKWYHISRSDTNYVGAGIEPTLELVLSSPRFGYLKYFISIPISVSHLVWKIYRHLSKDVGVRERLTDRQVRRVHCSSCSKELQKE